MVVLGKISIRKTLALCKMDFYWFISVFWVSLSCYIVVWLVVDEFCIKEMMKFQRSCCQKIFKIPVFVFTIH